MQIIKDQGEQQDTIKWQKSLRKEEGRHLFKASSGKLKGMAEFIFHHNLLGKRFIEMLSENLPNDIYVRKIDVSHNKIPEEPILLHLVDALKVNESVINFDLAENPGHTASVKKKLALCMLKNMEITKNMGAPIKPSWINLKQIEVLDSQLNEFVQGFSFAEE